ncbi:MAG: heavy metal translocating P-type ATPase [Pseudoruegeria sp.]
MSLAVPSTQACPACAAAPLAEAIADRAAQEPVSGPLILSLPTIHCAACISKVEHTLNAYPGVLNARVNLTLKRASIEAESEVTADDLTKALTDVGYEAHELDASALGTTATDRGGRDLLMRLAVAGFASMNVMLLSVAVWSGAEAATRDLFHWISAAIAIPAVGFAAQPFFRSAWAVVSKGHMNMDVPIALAIILALGTSLYETAHSGAHAYFDAALTLTFFLLAGRYLDYRTRAVARSAAEELTALEVPRALRVQDGKETLIAVDELSIGDTILVKPGGRMPVDGVVISGMSELDRSLLTGETLPVYAGLDTVVSAGEVNLTGPLTISATAVGRDTSLYRLADLVAVAENGRNRYTSLADKAAKLYAPGVHILSALSFIGWYFYTFDLRTALNIAAAVLIITCPCALGLAVPAVTTAASGRLFRKGMLIKNGTALERLSVVDTVVFDKTGTLTEGKPQLINSAEIDPKVMSIAMGLATSSSHPLAKAIADAAASEGYSPAELENIKELPGCGMQATYDGKPVRLGRADWIGAEAISETASYLMLDGSLPVVFRFTDQLRDGAQAAVSSLIAQGMKVHLLSGDTEAPVVDLANRLGISDWRAGVLPEEKAKHVADLAQSGHVLMVGDGLNDTAALAAADVSISPATALDAARVAADMVLLGNDLSVIGEATVTAQKATKRIRENFRIATLYNVIAIPIAIAGLATPLAAALAMSLSSITVSLNALRVR